MKASEILAAKGFGYVSEDDVTYSLLAVWKEFPMSFEDFKNLPLPTYFGALNFLNKRYEAERREMEKAKRHGHV